ncbi:hypothetical protein [uncultured Nostoc sp.]|uniref:hypothetical protein n=1 Tax=uncultured Nostoc sp. TaxID=340711 RepID=UPI0035CBA1CD
MTVVCNATPLINFAAINRLDILNTAFGQIVIPQAVCDETTVKGFPASEFVKRWLSSYNQTCSCSDSDPPLIVRLWRLRFGRRPLNHFFFTQHCFGEQNSKFWFSCHLL